MKKITKKQVINFLDRRKHPIDTNLRWLAVIPIIFLLIGLFLPLVGVDASLSVKDNANPENSQQLIRPEHSVIEVSTNDFISHKPLRDFAIWGQKIGDLSLFGINIYDTVMTPLPSFDALYGASDFLNSGALSFLTSAEFANFCHQFLGDFGQNVIDFAGVLNDIANKTGDALEGLSTILQRINSTSTGVREAVTQAEEYLNLIDNIVIVFFLLILIAIILFLVSSRRARFVPAIFLTIFSVIFVAIGIGVAIGDNIIADVLASSMQSLSTTIQTFLNDLVPGITSVLNTLFGINNIQFAPEVVIYCGVGYWFITLSLVALTALAYIVPSFKQRRLAVKPTKAIAEKSNHRK